MPGKIEEKVKLLCVKLKPNSAPEKAKSRILKSLRNAEEKSSQFCAISHPLDSWCKEMHSLPELDSEGVAEVVSNSRYFAFLLKDGRVCRLMCSSRADTHSKVAADATKRLNQPATFQMLSDAEYARQLQAQFDAERPGRGFGPSSQIRNTVPNVSLRELERQTREYMIIGSIPSPEYNRAPEYYRNLARSLSHQEDEEDDSDSIVPSLAPNPLHANLSTTVTYRPVSPTYSPPSPTYRPPSPSYTPTSPSYTVRISSLTDAAPFSPPPPYESLSVAAGNSSSASSTQHPPTASHGPFSSGTTVLPEATTTLLPPPSTLGERRCRGGQGVGKERVAWPEMGTLEWLVTKQNPDHPTPDSKFVAIAALHSEILLVSADSRQLYSWPCDESAISPVPHLLVEELGLSSESISCLASSDIRATLVTTSGKVATFYDELLRGCSDGGGPPPLVLSLSHAASIFPELEGDPITQLSVSSFLTTAATQTGRVFWWGLCPQAKENSTEDNARTRSSHAPSSSRGTITDGCLVRLKNGPPCGPNSAVYFMSHTHGPRVGKTVNIIDNSSIDPKTSILVKVFKDSTLWRQQQHQGAGIGRTGEETRDLHESSGQYESVEIWKLSDVVFLDDLPSILGRVVTIDQQQAIVDITHSQDPTTAAAAASSSSSSSSTGMKSTLKVFKVSELELCVDGDGNFKPKTKAKRAASSSTGTPSSSSIFTPSTRSLSHHVAGTVQHRPVCILDPSLPNPNHSGEGFDSEEAAPATKIHGYKPLALHTTDEGPNLLAQRNSDGNVFLVCSSHASSGAFVSTSFIAIGSKDSKPSRCTVEEESVNALEAGLTTDDSILSLLHQGPINGASRDNDSSSSSQKGLRQACSETENNRRSLSIRVGQKRKLRPDREMTTTEEDPSRDSQGSLPAVSPPTRPSFISCYNSQVLLLQGANGIIWPLRNGLGLKPSADSKSHKSSSLPTQPYCCVTSRLHAISQNNSALIFVLVPRPQFLMPLVQSGNVPGAEVILNRLGRQINAPQPQPASDSSGPGPTKRACLDMVPAEEENLEKPDADMVEVVSETQDATTPTEEAQQRTPFPSRPLQELSNSQASSKDACENMPPSKKIKCSNASPNGESTVTDLESIAKPGEDVRKTVLFVDKTDPILDKPDPIFAKPVSLLDKPDVDTVVKEWSSRVEMPQLIDIDFDSEMQVLEKDTTSSIPQAKANPSPFINLSLYVGLEDPFASTVDNVPIAQRFGLEVLLEATTCNSNIIHVCCQVEGSEKEGRKETNFDLCGTTPLFRPHRVDHMKYQSITFQPEFQDKSFEELRHQYHSQPYATASLGGVGRAREGSLVERRIAILEKLLSSREIRPIVVKLLCSQNAKGKTPFMMAISQHNYSAALQILSFVEEYDLEQQNQAKTSILNQSERDMHVCSPKPMDEAYSTSSPNLQEAARITHEEQNTGEKKLLHKAILAPMGGNMTPLQALLASLAPFYDSKSLRLHVSSIPPGYTAQQLLKLFQVRYPSAYKAEIYKPEESGGNVTSSSGSESTDSEDENMQVNGDHLSRRALHSVRFRRIGRLGRHGRRRRNGNSIFGGGIVGATMPHSGVVCFSDVTQLRAARKEMHDFRVTQNLSRSTGFGQTQSISFLSVQLDPESDSEAEEERLRGEFPPGALDPLLPFSAWEATSRGSSVRDQLGLRTRGVQATEQTRAHKFSSPLLVHKLLSRLLAHREVATAVDSVGETVLASVIHNPRCLIALGDSRKEAKRITETQAYPVPKLQSLSDVIQSRRSHSRLLPLSSLLPTTSFSCDTTLSDYISSITEALNSNSSGALLPPRGIPRYRQLRVEESSLFATGDHRNSPDPPPLASETRSLASQILNVTSPFVASDTEGGDTHNQTPLESVFSQQFDSESLKTDTPMEAESSLDTPGSISQALTSQSGSSVEHETQAGFKFGTGMEMIGMESRPKDQNGSETAPTVDEATPTTTTLRFGVSASSTSLPMCTENAPDTSRPDFDILNILVTDWPVVVTTILGVFPDTAKASDTSDVFISGSLKSLPLSPVHLLDNFTTDLILNCDESIINTLVATIVNRMNKAITSGSELSLRSLNFSEINVSKVDESTVALLVGKRFLNSLVRVLALEHSRVKNTFLEMQHLRRRGLSHILRPDLSPRKDIVATVKHILSSFSWLAVQTLAESAEAAAAPVRLGVSKPLGAQSVSADYHTPRSLGPPSSRVSHRNEDPTQNLARQMHVRVALQVSEGENGNRGLSSVSLPSEGVVLRPQSKETDLGLNHSILSGGSVNDSSFEDFEFDSQELSNNNPDRGIMGFGMGGRSSRITRVRYAVHDPPASIRLGFAEREPDQFLLDLDGSSSDDDYQLYEDPFGDPAVIWSSAANLEESNADEIYPFAWALDGRRIGENSMNVNRPNSPNSFMFGGPPEPPVPLCSIPSIRFGAGFLARTFARFVKDLVDIAQQICDHKTTRPSLSLPPSMSREHIHATISLLEQTWAWVVKVLDVAEGQLQQGEHFDSQRYVVSLRGGGGQGAGVRQAVRIPSRSFIGSTPGEYISYLLRTQSQEDEHCLPVIDLYGYEHVVYVLDGLIYTLTNWPKAATALVSQSDSSTASPLTNQNAEQTDSTSMEEQHSADKLQELRFFERTESVIVGEEDPEIQRSNEQFFGSEGAALEKPEFVGPPNQWGPQVQTLSYSLDEAYPLAQQPHLLKPFAKKEHLFTSSGKRKGSMDEGRGEGKGKRTAERKLPVSYAHLKTSPPDSLPLTLTWTVEHTLQRWNSAISVFAHIFLAEGPGSERSNFLNVRAGFASRMARFRHQVSQLFEASQSSRDWASTVSSTLSLRIRREHLLQDSLDTLQQMIRFHYSQIRVKFEGEEGSGPGVNRGFFSSFANELKLLNPVKPPMNKIGVFFYEPGKRPEQSGLYAPRPFVLPSVGNTMRNVSLKMQRKHAFQAIGRFFGLCFWFRYTVPFMVCRHVAKYLLGRELAWHDLAFYNADLYEGLRRMMLDAEQGKTSREEFKATYCCYFEAPLLGQSSEPVLVDLIPDGSQIPVTPDRVQEYVRLYAMFMMVGCVKDELQAMKEGLADIIPSEILSGLTAEDFQLLLSGGSANITLSRLKSTIRFNHTHGNPANVCDRFEKMFWRVVSHLNNTQRQQLLYFATGSAALPATTDRAPAVSITIDVIGSTNIESLPVASTCSQRMSIPLYPSYSVLKKKLLQAIQCQAYGLG